MRFSLALAAVMLLAGCAAPPDVAPSQEAADDASASTSDKPTAAEDPPLAPVESEDVAPIVYSKQIHWDLEVFAALMGSSQWEQERLEFEVPREATGLLVELDWTDPMQDLDPTLGAPGECGDSNAPSFAQVLECFRRGLDTDGDSRTWWNRDGATGLPDHGARIQPSQEHFQEYRCYEPQDDCTWFAAVWSHDINQDIDMTLYATVFFDGPVPEGYSAIPA